MRSGDSLPTRAVRALAGLPKEAGLITDTSRKLTGESAWLVSNRHNLACLVFGSSRLGVALSCAFSQDIRAGRLMLAAWRGLPEGKPRARVTGVLPDGVRAATILEANGKRMPVTVRDNYYSFAVPDPISLRYNSDGSPVTVPIAQPPKAKAH